MTSNTRLRAEILPRGCPTPTAVNKNSQRVPNKENKMRNGSLTPAFLGAQERVEMLHHPCILRDPQRQPRGAKNQ